MINISIFLSQRPTTHLARIFFLKWLFVKKFRYHFSACMVYLGNR